jgi:predicted RNase H-like HicB family nuclease
MLPTSPKLDLSSCGDTVDAARKNLKTAAQLFLEEAANMGTLEEILKKRAMNREVQIAGLRLG